MSLSVTSWAHLGGAANKSRPFSHFLGPSWGVGQTSPGLSVTSWAHLVGAEQVQAILSRFGPILGGGANKSRPFCHFLGLSWGVGQTSRGHSLTCGPGHSLTSWAHLRGGANKSRPFSHFLGPSCGGGTSPGLSVTSWAQDGGWGKQVQAILSVRGPILWGRNKSRPFCHFLSPSWGAGQTSPGHSLTSWAHLRGPGKQVQAILSLFGPLGGGANKSRPFSHFLGPSWGAEEKVLRWSSGTWRVSETKEAELVHTTFHLIFDAFPFGC